MKDHISLVRAMIELWRSEPLARRRLRLTLAGDGPMRGEIESILRQANMSELVWFAGARDDIPCIMRSLDLFVLPSLSEGISNTLLEAMACGLPVVATRVGGTPELVEEGTTAKLVPAADYQALAAAIREYFLNREMARLCGSAARRIAEQRFGLDMMVKNYVDLYDRVLAGSRRSREC